METESGFNQNGKIDDEVFKIETPKSEAERIVNLYLKTLNLDWNYLKGKKVLDIGAKQAEFAKAAKKISTETEVISVDSLDYLGYQDDAVKPPQGVPYVRAKVQQLPFPDETFDLVLSRAAPPTTFTSNPKDIQEILKEISRVLKDGGEFRFGPAALLFVQAGLMPKDGAPLSDEGSKNLARESVEKSYEILKNIDPRISLEENIITEKDIPKNITTFLYSFQHYYRLLK